MTKEELEAKREELNGRLDELFMLWKIAGDEQLPFDQHHLLMGTVKFKETQVETMLQELSRQSQKDFDRHRIKEYENRNAQIGR